jgi:hypothetical protein
MFFLEVFPKRAAQPFLNQQLGETDLKGEDWGKCEVQTGLAFPFVRAYYQGVRNRVFARAVNLPVEQGCKGSQ